jgi:hypothetical protein
VIDHCSIVLAARGDRALGSACDRWIHRSPVA